MPAPAPLALQPTLDNPLHIEAASLTERLPGPGLSGRTVVYVVVSVITPNGTPLTGLPADAFTLRAVAGSGQGRAVAVSGVHETAPGIYTLSLGLTSRATHDPTMLAVFVHDREMDREGRHLVRIDP